MAVDSTGEDGGLCLSVLGPLECHAGGIRLPLGGPQQERTLVVLLLDAGRVVPVRRLVEAVWEGEPPATAEHQIRKMVADLRRRLPGGHELLHTDGGGYRALVAEDQFDLSIFRVRLRRAREAQAAGLSANAADELRAGLALWRGPVLAGLGSPVIEAMAAELEELRLAATEELVDIRLEAGPDPELVSELRGLVRLQPLRERLRGQLMLALYRSGRQADALEEYARVRALFADELGIDPGPALSRLHEDILRSSPELDPPSVAAGQKFPVEVIAPRPSGSPRSLPYDLPDFTGRMAELAQLRESAGSAEGHMKIISITGMGGCGKTALAVRAAHQLAEHYPDGQLHVDLAGFTPGQQPLDPSAAIDVLLHSLGVPGERIPDGLLSRIALWRVSTAQRRLLILLDNALDAEQVRPLLPASPGCLVLVTNRVRLDDLDGVETLSLDVLTEEDSHEVLVRALGEKRVAAEPEAATDLIRLCGRLPLALRISAGRLASRPRWTLAHLVGRLHEQTRLLDELRGGDRSVAASLRLSHDSMTADYQDALRLLGLLPGQDVDVHAAAALLGLSLDEAERRLEYLVDVNLLEQHTLGRYVFHDLVRSFAHSLQPGVCPPEDQAAAERLVEYYAGAVSAAAQALYQGWKPDPARHEPKSTPTLPEFPGPDAAQAWMGQERANVLAALRASERMGLHRQAARIPRNLGPYLQENGYLQEYLEATETGVRMAEAVGDPYQLQRANTFLAVSLWQLSRFREGAVHARRAVELAVELRDLELEAGALSRFAVFHSSLGDYREGLRCLERALAMHQDSGDVREEATTRVSIGSSACYLGQYAYAEQESGLANIMCESLGLPYFRVLALTNLSSAQVGLGRPEHALESILRAEKLSEQLPGSPHHALVLARKAGVLLLLGRVEEAHRHALEARDMLWTIHSPSVVVRVHNVLGRVEHQRGELRQALTCHREALAGAVEIGARIDEAEALQEIAKIEVALDDPASAAIHREQARDRFDRLGVPVGHIRTS
ncbi:DNA-binding SARP family transcriptional activator [Streptacidiphilus sp. MAP12-33]|uniref:AfsR/SARP family transcriptional regulator n=1 Tax=Streptacidiphilus sp. MAP12-33 TaxID=3156266 RepID=UPI0035198CC4